MNSLSYTIPDTAEYPNAAEKEYLETLKAKGGHESFVNDPDAQTDCITSLIDKGALATFHYGDEIHIYDPRTCFITTVCFKLREFDLVKNLTSGKLTPKDADEEKKQFKSRRLISYWVCNVKEINDATAAFYFYLFTFRSRAVVSFPEFMQSKFAEDVAAADANSKEITPEVQRIRCNICGHITNTRLKMPTIICEECGRSITK